MMVPVPDNAMMRVIEDVEVRRTPFTVVQGVGGCGKSTLYRILARHNPGHTLCLASTGCAAENLSREGCNCRASTIHSAFGLEPAELYEYRHEDFVRNAGLLDATDLILVDEMSMVSCSLMDWILNLVRDANDGRPEQGRIRLVLFGDVLQLAPVFRPQPFQKEICTSLYGDNKFFFNAHSFNAMDPVYHILEKNYRQTDAGFSKAVISLRNAGVSHKGSLGLINTRVGGRDEYARNTDGFFVTVVGTNREREAINSMEVSRLCRAGCAKRDYPDIRGESPDGLFGQDHLGSGRKETLYEGERVICTCNSERYKNGTMGMITGFEEESGLPVIETQDGERVAVRMHKSSQNIPFADEDGEIGYRETDAVWRMGCQPAYALTVHKVQGLTLDNIYFQIGGWIPESGVYVVLSRCRTLEGIGLSRKLTERDIRFDAEAFGFFQMMMRRMTT